jgi:hypothetical protein
LRGMQCLHAVNFISGRHPARENHEPGEQVQGLDAPARQ